MNFARDDLLSTASGRRLNFPGVLVLIADGKSSDDIIGPLNTVRAAGPSVTSERDAALILKPAAVSHTGIPDLSTPGNR